MPESVTITDNRSGQSVEIPIENGGISAAAWSKLLPGIWFLGMGIVIQGDLAGRGRPGLSSSLAGLAAAVTVLLDLALIPPLGVYGGALASVGAYTTFGVASLIALHRVTGIPVRRLAIPDRSDVRAYTTLIRRAFGAVRKSRRVR